MRGGKSAQRPHSQRGAIESAHEIGTIDRRDRSVSDVDHDRQLSPIINGDDVDTQHRSLVDDVV
jgi:hypothetical protein